MTRRFGDRILELREQCDLNQAEVARRVGIHRSFLCRLEGGSVNPSGETIERLAEVLGGDAIELYAMAEITPEGWSYEDFRRWLGLVRRYQKDGRYRYKVKLVKE